MLGKGVTCLANGLPLPRRLVQQVSFFSAPASRVGQQGCHFASTRPFPPSRPSRSRGPIAAARTCPGWRPGRSAGPDARSAARRACAPDGARRRELTVPSARRPDDRAAAGCGRRQARQGARQERQQSWLSPVSTSAGTQPGGGKRAAAASVPGRVPSANGFLDMNLDNPVA